MAQHQIIGLRKYKAANGEEKGKDQVFPYPFDSIVELFKDPEKYLADIEASERYNLYFTVAKCAGKREFLSQKFVHFDIDGIDKNKIEDTLQCALRSLGLPGNEVLASFSGNGIQFFVELVDSFDDPGFFEQQRQFYKAICSKIDMALTRAELLGKADPAVWSTARIMRMPNTKNIKPNKPESVSRVLCANSVPRTFDLQTVAGIPKLKQEDSIVRYDPPDSEFAVQECLNIKLMWEHPDEVKEPLWYACASIFAHLKGYNSPDRDRWHQYSSRYKGYSVGETDEKLAQAGSGSGPRTCANFATIEGNRCAQCPHQGKQRSPIQLHGPDYIKTQATGFHSEFQDKDGNKKVGKPCYTDLVKFFCKTYGGYVTNSDAGAIFIYNGKYYESFNETEVKGFAEKHFLDCTSSKANEFFGKITRGNLQKAEWFAKSSENKLNLANGVLNTVTGEFRPGHSSEEGFLWCFDYDYDPNAKAPRFEQFLDEVMCGDKELTQILLEFGGYALSNDPYWVHKTVLLVGDGRNGKGTFCRTLKLLAPGSFSSVRIKQMNDDNHISTMEGKLFNIGDEGDKAAFQSTDAFKSASSGEEITARRVYERSYPFRNKAKMIFSCNEIPLSESDTSHGFFSRFIIVPFERQFIEGQDMDSKLEEKFMSERSGILNLFLNAYKQTRARGKFPVSNKSEIALTELKFDSNPVKTWVSDCLEILPFSQKDDQGYPQAKLGDLFSDFNIMCQANNFKPINSIAFGKRLSKLIPQYTERKVLKKVVGEVGRYISGVRLSNPSGVM